MTRDFPESFQVTAQRPAAIWAGATPLALEWNRNMRSRQRRAMCVTSLHLFSLWSLCEDLLWIFCGSAAQFSEWVHSFCLWSTTPPNIFINTDIPDASVLTSVCGARSEKTCHSLLCFWCHFLTLHCDVKTWTMTCEMRRIVASRFL